MRQQPVKSPVQRRKPLCPSHKPHTAALPPLPGSRQLLDALAACLVSRWDELLRTRRQALNSFEVDQIHDLRVASRRLCGILEQLGPFVGNEKAGRLRRPIKRLTKELGQLRNLDEARLYFEKNGKEKFEPLLRFLKQQRCHEATRTRQLLESLDCSKLERQILVAAKTVVSPANIASQELLAFLSRRNLELYHPIYDLLPLAALTEMVDERHALRIAIKKWRYFTELLHDILGQKQSDLLAAMRQYQSVLGEMNDRAVFRNLLDGVSDLTDSARAELLDRISQEQVGLLKKLQVMLDKQPLVYQLEL